MGISSMIFWHSPYPITQRKNSTRESVREHFAKASEEGSPLFYFANISPPHRPFRSSDKVDIGIDESAIELPPFLPDTPAFRQDWAEYLGTANRPTSSSTMCGVAWRTPGKKGNTIIGCMGDHGPAYHRGNLALYDFGTRVPLAISGPMIQSGLKTNEMVSGIDLMNP